MKPTPGTAGSPPGSATPLALVRLIEGYRLTQAIYAAARLRLADLVHEGPRTTAELAHDTGAHAGHLYRLLRALASARVFTETEPGRFAQTPLSDRLRADHPASLRAFALMHGAPWHWGAWGQLTEAVETGRPAGELALGRDFWRELERGAAAPLLDEAMAGLSRTLAPLLLVLDLPPRATVVDVGGGLGAMLEALLAHQPTLRGVLFDRAPVIKRARQSLRHSPWRERIELRAGDFFAAVPPGDVFLLKFIVHDWDDAQAVRVLERCRRAARPRARLVLIDSVIPVGDAPHQGKITDLEMMVLTPGGRERTEAELRDLLERGGWRLEQVIPTLLPASLVVARPRRGSRR